MADWSYTRRKRKWGRRLRTMVVVTNILFWFVGCAILSLGVWMRFIEGPVKEYFLVYPQLKMALTILLSSGVIFLVLSLVGTCGANMKNEILLSLYTITMAILWTSEIVVIFSFLSKKRDTITSEFAGWYNREVFFKLDRTMFPDEWEKNWEIVEHVQESLSCCGIRGASDFQEYNHLTPIDAQQLRMTCIIESEATDSTNDIQRPEFYGVGCHEVLVGEADKYIVFVWIISPFVLLLQLVSLVTTILFVIYLIKGGKYDDENEDCSALVDQLDTMSIKSFQDYSRKFQEGEQLPKPKVFRCVKKSRENSFGISLGYDEDRKGVIVTDVDPSSNAAYAGLLPGSRVIELNGMVAQGATKDEVQFKMDASLTEIKILVVEAKADEIYRECKVAVNLRNVEGVTGDECDYKPKLVKLERSGGEGYGFHLLYLDDRKGEYIEEVQPRGLADRAGLRVGDRIIEVNGVNIEAQRSRDVVNRIRGVPDAVVLLLVDPKTDGYFRKKAVTITASLAEEFFDDKVGKVRKGKAKKDKSHVKPRYCRLVKAHREDYGLYVVIDNTRIGQVVRWVDCGGPADRAGLRIGDRIIEVNGINCEYETHQRLVATIKAGKNICHYIVVDEDYDRQYKRGKPRLCRIFKEEGAFGFCVCYDDEKDGHYVEEVDPGGPAERAGLKTGDRVIQINGMNIEADDHDDVIQRLRQCEVEVLLLVTDSKADTHYKNIVDFKIKGMEQIDWDAISIPAEPYFMPVDSDAETELHEEDTITIGMSDSISLSETKSFTTFASEGTLRGDLQRNQSLGIPRHCTLLKTDHEQHGFFLAIDRDRNGQVIRRVERNGPADAAGLRDGDRIIEINGINCERLSHEQVVDFIKKSGNEIKFLVIDERSDDVKAKNKPILFRIIQGKSGYGFYIWHDENGHYVEDITIGSPADRAGLRAGDRIIEINNVNIEKESTEDVFYRIKACHNVVNLLAVDAKTFVYYKKNSIPITAYKADMKFSGWKGWGGSERDGKTTGVDVNSKTITTSTEIFLCKEENEEDWGFKLANTVSFDDNKPGHVIHWVEKGGAAEYGGLNDGDRLTAIDGKNVVDLSYEEVIAILDKACREVGEVNLTIQFEESLDEYTAHDIELVKQPSEAFGFYAWFDDQGHYIEDVTIGSIADKAGLKVGDRIKEVNHRNIESEVHEVVVARIREAGDICHLNIMSVPSNNVKEIVTPKRLLITKEKGTFGFYLNTDDKGNYFEHVAQGGGADKAGVNIGDRIIEINRQSLEGISHERVIEMIKGSGDSVEMTILSSSKEMPGMRSNSMMDDTPIFQQLLGYEKIDYKVEGERMLARAVRKRRGQQGDKRGTNFNNPTPSAEGDKEKDGEQEGETKARRRKKKGKDKKIKFDVNTESLEVQDEDDSKKKKKAGRRKKKDKDDDKLSDEEEKKKSRRSKSSRRRREEEEMDEEQRAEAKKASNKALKSRTKKARNDLLTNGKKSSRKLEKTQMQGKGGAQTWDWEETENRPLDVITEEAEGGGVAPSDNPLVNLD